MAYYNIYYKYHKKELYTEVVLDEREENGQVKVSLEDIKLEDIGPTTLITEPSSVDLEALKPAPVEPDTLEPSFVEPEVLKSSPVDPKALTLATADPEALQPAPVDPEALERAPEDPETLEQAHVYPEAVKPLSIEPNVNSSTVESNSCWAMPWLAVLGGIVICIVVMVMASLRGKTVIY